MNTEGLEIKIKIPKKVGTTDGNGVLHTKESYEKALKYNEMLPLIIYDENTNPIQIGEGTLVDDGNNLVFEGCVHSGGFGCDVLDARLIDSMWHIDDMKITSVGFDTNKRERETKG